MSSVRWMVRIVLPLVGVAACAHEKSADEVRYSGSKHYYALCASCHGADAKGNGPVAALLRAEPPDLTMISARFDNHFPWEYVWQTIDGRAKTAAHGPREMPVWGNVLYFSHRKSDPEARGRAEQLITELVSYLQFVQTTGASNGDGAGNRTR